MGTPPSSLEIEKDKVEALVKVNASIIKEINEQADERVPTKWYEKKTADEDWVPTPVLKPVQRILRKWAFKERLEPVDGIDVTLNTYADLVRLNSELAVPEGPAPTEVAKKNLERIQVELGEIQGYLMIGAAPEETQTAVTKAAKRKIDETLAPSHSEHVFEVRVKHAPEVNSYDLNAFHTVILGGGKITRDLTNLLPPHTLVLPAGPFHTHAAHLPTIAELSNVLMVNKTVTDLRVYDFCPSRRDHLDVLRTGFFRALTKNWTITHLTFSGSLGNNLSWNCLDNVLCANPTLLSLSILGEEITSPRLGRLCHGLKHNKTLQRLILDVDSFMSDWQARPLAVTIAKENKTLTSVTLQSKKSCFLSELLSIPVVTWLQVPHDE